MSRMTIADAGNRRTMMVQNTVRKMEHIIPEVRVRGLEAETMPTGVPLAPIRGRNAVR